MHHSAQIKQEQNLFTELLQIMFKTVFKEAFLKPNISFYIFLVYNNPGFHNW